ncbi:MAG: hypothetical protein IJ291_01715 [Lachnospiraceae bacterium]|nr:hypothetical protein [Lachnospiraceae bacterium]
MSEIKQGKPIGKNRYEGQITIAMSLVFTLILSVFLSMVAAARSAALEVKLECAAQTAVYSLFSQYHKGLAQRYGLLFVDSSFGTDSPSYANLEDRLLLYFEKNMHPEGEQSLLFADDWFGVTDTAVTVSGVRTFTDMWCGAFYNQAVSYMKDLVSADLYEEVQGWIKVQEEYEIDGETVKEQNAELLKEASEAVGDEDWSVTKVYPQLDIMYFTRPATYLLAGDLQMSKKGINPANLLTFRDKNKGSEALEPEDMGNPWNDFCFSEYILSKFGHYGDVREDSALDYQVEYIIVGLPTDGENMTFVLNSIFYIRCAANIIPLLQSEEAKQIVKPISELLTIFKIPPQVSEALIYMLWCALESVADVHGLIDGERVELIKKYEDFTVSLEGLTSLGAELLPGEDEKEPVSEVGLAYEDYLRLFLTGIPRTVKATRCGDMIEADIRLTEGNEYFRLDGCVDAVSVEFAVHTSFGHFYTVDRKYDFF